MRKVNLERRVQIGLEKKERTRAAIVEAAYRLFALRGFDAPTTDDIVHEAGIARGTLYGHFATKEEIMRCVALDFANSIEHAFAHLLDGVADPLLRIAIRIRFLCEHGVQKPTWGWLIIRAVPTGPLGTESRRGFLHDLAAAHARGQVSLRGEQCALDMIQGTVIIGLRTMLSDPRVSRHHAEDLVVTILRGLGLTGARALQVATRSASLYAEASLAMPPAPRAEARA